MATMVPTLVAVLAGALVLAGCVQPSADGTGPLVGQRAPAFSLVDLEAVHVGPANSSGRVMLIDFMGSNCSTCHLAMRALVPLNATYGDQVDFVSVDVGAFNPGLGGRNEQDLAAFRDQYAAGWSFAMDQPHEQTAARYEVIALPTTVVVAADGVIAYREASIPTEGCMSTVLDHVLDHGYDNHPIRC